MSEAIIFAAHRLLTRLADNELRVEPVADLDLIRSYVADLGKPYLTSVLSPDFNDFTTNTSNWLAAWRGSELVYLGGMRLEDVTDQGITSHWHHVFSRHYRNGLKAIEKVSPIAEDRLHGRLAYCGDLFCKPGHRGSAVSLGAFCDLAQILAYNKWKPDAFYAFIRKEDLIRGALHRYRFTSHIEEPYVWCGDPPPPRSNGEGCVYIKKDEVLEKVRLLNLER